MKVLNRYTGEALKIYLFVGCLTYSRYAYVEETLNMITKLSNYHLLIVDEWLLDIPSDQEDKYLLEIFEQRYHLTEGRYPCHGLAVPFVRNHGFLTTEYSKITQVVSMQNLLMTILHIAVCCISIYLIEFIINWIYSWTIQLIDKPIERTWNRHENIK